jgi:hypothetical protein
MGKAVIPHNAASKARVKKPFCIIFPFGFGEVDFDEALRILFAHQ